MSLPRSSETALALFFTGIAAMPLAGQSPSEAERWHRVAGVLRTDPAVNAPELDFPTRVMVVGDSLAVWFSREQSSVQIWNVRSSSQRSVGRAGRGPMEFSSLSTLGPWNGDSIAVLDNQQLRVSVVSLGTGNGRQILYSQIDAASESRVLGRTVTGEDLTIVRSGNTQDGPDGLVKIPADIRMLRDGKSSRPSHRVDGGTMVRFHWNGASSVYAPPISTALPFEISEDRIAWLAGSGDSLMIWHARSDHLAVRKLRAPRFLLTAADRNSLMEQWVSRVRSPKFPEREVRAKIRMPSSVSAVNRLYLVSPGALWLRISRDPQVGSPTTAIELSEGGVVLRCFSLPAEHVLLGLGRSIAVIGVKTEDDTYRLSVGRLPLSCARRSAAM